MFPLTTTVLSKSKDTTSTSNKVRETVDWLEGLLVAAGGDGAAVEAVDGGKGDGDAGEEVVENWHGDGEGDYGKGDGDDDLERGGEGDEILPLNVRSKVSEDVVHAQAQAAPSSSSSSILYRDQPIVVTSTCYGSQEHHHHHHPTQQIVGVISTCEGGSLEHATEDDSTSEAANLNALETAFENLSLRSENLDQTTTTPPPPTTPKLKRINTISNLLIIMSTQAEEVEDLRSQLQEAQISCSRWQTQYHTARDSTNMLQQQVHDLSRSIDSAKRETFELKFAVQELKKGSEKLKVKLKVKREEIALLKKSTGVLMEAVERAEKDTAEALEALGIRTRELEEERERGQGLGRMLREEEMARKGRFPPPLTIKVGAGQQPSRGGRELA
jgi:hypothetical protein